MTTTFQSSPTCTGDAVQCAILHQSWINGCKYSTFSKLDIVGSEVSATGDDLYSETDLSSKLSSVLNQPYHGGYCPSPANIHLGLGTFVLSYQLFCDLASRLSGMLVFIFSLIAVRIVYGSFD